MGEDSLLRKPHFLKVIYLGICFLCLFTAYSTAQAFITPLHKGVGFITLALVYGFFAATSLVSPMILHRVGLKAGMVFAGLSYSSFIFCASIPPEITEVPLLITACLVGLSGACLWLAQGMYISQIVQHTGPETKGFVVGIFFAIHGFSSVVGAIITSLMTGIGVDPFTMMKILGGVGLLSAIMFLLVPKVPPVKGDVELDTTGEKSEAATTKPSRPVSVKEVVTAPFKSRNVLCLTMSFISQGTGQTFSFAVFTSLIPVSELAYVLVMFGLLSLTTSLWGRLYDRRGWKPLVYLDVFMLFSGIAACWVIQRNAIDGNWLRYLAAACLGTSNSCDVAICGASILRVVPSEDPQLSTAVWALYRLLQCGTAMIMLLLNLTVPFDVIAIITCCSYLMLLVAFHFIQFPAATGGGAVHRHVRVAPEELPEVPEEVASPHAHPDSARLSAGA